MNQSDYWKLAYKAISEGLLTKEEALLIARVGTRKQGFWDRHYRDLKEIVESRKEDKNEFNT